MPKKSQRDEDIGPKVKTIYTIKLNDAQLDQLADYLEDGKKGPWFHYDMMRCTILSGLSYMLGVMRVERVTFSGHWLPPALLQMAIWCVNG